MTTYNKEQYDKSKPMQFIDVTCDNCNTVFQKQKRLLDINLKKGMNTYCGCVCQIAYRSDNVTVPCGQCGKSVTRSNKILKESKSGHLFCNNSCSATYGNTHKTYGTRRSKMEEFIEDMIVENYKDLEMVCNGKETINSELDFYFPTLFFAIELNGIFHYEPIFGDDKLGKIQNNDDRKMIACYEKGIELAVIDTSGAKSMSQMYKDKYWGIVVEILDQVIKNRNVPTI